MAAKALWTASKIPATTKSKNALEDRLCRCGVHNRVVRAFAEPRPPGAGKWHGERSFAQTFHAVAWYRRGGHSPWRPAWRLGQAPAATPPFSLRNNRNWRVDSIGAGRNGDRFHRQGRAWPGDPHGIGPDWRRKSSRGGSRRSAWLGADTSRGRTSNTRSAVSRRASGSAIRAGRCPGTWYSFTAASRRFGVRARSAGQGRESLLLQMETHTFWEVASREVDLLKGDITAAASPKKPREYSIAGKSISRIDLPGS